MELSKLVEQLGVTAVIAVGLIYLIKFLTGELKSEIESLHNIIVKLIDKVNALKETVDKKWKE